MSSDEVILPAPPPALAVVFVASTMIFFLAIVVVPLAGVLVRFRADYNPKGLHLAEEGRETPHIRRTINYLQMFARVYRKEGMSGLYKGLMPTAISTLLNIVIALAIDNDQLRHGKYTAPGTGVLGTLFNSLAALIIFLPISILTYRAITTTEKLTYTDLMGSLRALLTPTERRRPWILYMTPGLMAAETIHICVVVLFLGPLRQVLLPKTTQPVLSLSDISVWKLAIFFIPLCASVLVLTPLEVIVTRLAIQRNNASAEYNPVAQDVDGHVAVEHIGSEEEAPVIGLRHNNASAEYNSVAQDVDGHVATKHIGSEEEAPVIELRDERDPYGGLVDCAKRIIDEEGVMTLYRAWWITFFATCGGSFSAFV